MPEAKTSQSFPPFAWRLPSRRVSREGGSRAVRPPALAALTRLSQGSHLRFILPDALGLGTGALSGSQSAQKNASCGRGGRDTGGGAQSESAHGVVLLTSVPDAVSLRGETVANAN